MAYTITLISNDVKSGKTTIAFNLATLIAKKNKKILLINQGYIPSLNLLKDLGKNITKKIITPFKLIECSQYLSVLLFSESKINPAKYDYLKLFSKQFQLLESKFDFIIIDSNHI
jgi:cellulose biosynthesis protein BcsQ